MKLGAKSGWWFAGLLALSVVFPSEGGLRASESAAEAPRKSRLSSAERNRLRFQLENLYNEVDLLIRNRGSDHLDLERQEREAQQLRVYDRIPFRDDIPGLKKEMTESAARFGLKLHDLKVTRRSRSGAAIPKKLTSDDPRLRLKPDQVAEQIHFEAVVTGDELVKQALGSWMESWQEDQLRLVEPEGGYGKKSFQPGKKAGQWIVRAHAFKFRDFTPPEVALRDPMKALPEWARKNPQSFAQSEPQLWDYVRKAKELAPKAKSEYATRSKFIVNDARMSFFFSKATPKGEQAGRASGHGH